MSREQIAKALGLSTQAVWKLETDRARPSIETYDKYHDLFGVSYDLLLDKEPKTIRSKIQKIMDDNQLTPKDFASSVGCKTDEVINILESGTEPTDELLSLICQRYGLKETYLRKEDVITRDRVKSFAENPENWDYILMAISVKEKGLKPKYLDELTDFVLKNR
jgi:transcriptional regulator with XRE-family HTH domain